jgi:hypothetical protein
MQRTRPISPSRQRMSRTHSSEQRHAGLRLRRKSATIGVILFLTGIALATIPARDEWRAPDQLSIVRGPSGTEIVTVRLATPETGVRLLVLEPWQDTLVRRLSASTQAQTIVVPRSRAGVALAMLAAPSLFLIVSN